RVRPSPPSNPQVRRRPLLPAGDHLVTRRVEGSKRSLRLPAGERATLPEEVSSLRWRARLDWCCLSPGWGCRPTLTRVALASTVSPGGGGSMFPTDVIGQERT